MYESYRDSAAGGNVAAALAGVYGRGSPAETSAKAAAVATLAYARMHQDTGFPYGISGVAMPSYNYGSELYNYVSNGFPRKSRICSYCAKVFTRSTTRRYHEKRCPLLRAAGSLMKGNADSNNVTAPTAATSGASENTELSGGVQPAHPPPLLAMTGESPPPLLTAATTSLTATTSLGQASGARPAPLNTSSFYTSYGSHSQSLLSTSDGTTPSSTSAAALMASPHAAAASSSGVDQNRNSVLTSAKQEADQGSDARSDVARDAGTHSPGSRESDLLRNKLRSRGGGDQQQMFSPLSVTSPSPSPGSGSVDDDADYDGAEDLTLRAAGSVVKPGLLAGGDLYTTGNAPPHKPHYLTDRHHPQALSQEGGTRYMMGTASGTDLTPTPVKVKLESGQEMLDVSSDKDDSSYRARTPASAFVTTMTWTGLTTDTRGWTTWTIP
nr:hypothetical protein BaRGS_024142 [Batillaria attramentaria]